MWQCPRCGREFKNTNQNHFCSDGVKAVDEYIDVQPEVVRPLLRQLRDTLRNALPEAEERISWQMPTYWRGQNIIHFAAFKNHIGIYPGDTAIAHFSEQLKDHKTSKGAAQFPYDKPLPLDLIAAIARWCFEAGNHHEGAGQNA